MTGQPTWFSRGCDAWVQLSAEAIDSCLVAYFEARLALVEADELQRGVALTLRPGLAPAFEFSTMSLETVGRFKLDCWDPFLCADFAGLETLPRERDRRAHALLARAIDDGLERIADWSREFRMDVDSLIVEIVPCRSPDARAIPSGSCNLTPGAVFLSCGEDPDAAAELIVHEASHIDLALLDHLPA